MNPYAIIDLHCDTLTGSGYYTKRPEVDSLNDSRRMLSLDRLPQGVHWAQFFAIFIPDELRGQDAVEFFEANTAEFQRQTRKYAEKISPCRTWADIAGAWALTITWNGENELGSGNVTDHGLSPLGREAIPELEQAGILLDVSHLNDAGLDDLLKLAQKPFLATHSNARAVCPHKRNLTDEQIQELVRRDCLIGLNFANCFLRAGGEHAGLDDLMRHVEHFFRLGAETNLALGSDYDGTDVPPELGTAEKVPVLLDYFLDRGLTQAQAEGILYRNAQTFFQKNLI